IARTWLISADLYEFAVAGTERRRRRDRFVFQRDSGIPEKIFVSPECAVAIAAGAVLHDGRIDVLEERPVFFWCGGKIFNGVYKSLFLLEAEVVQGIEPERSADQFEAKSIGGMLGIHKPAQSGVDVDAKGSDERHLLLQKTRDELLKSAVSFFRIFSHKIEAIPEVGPVVPIRVPVNLKLSLRRILLH